MLLQKLRNNVIYITPVDTTFISNIDRSLRHLAYIMHKAVLTREAFVLEWFVIVLMTKYCQLTVIETTEKISVLVLVDSCIL